MTDETPLSTLDTARNGIHSHAHISLFDTFATRRQTSQQLLSQAYQPLSHALMMSLDLAAPTDAKVRRAVPFHSPPSNPNANLVLFLNPPSDNAKEVRVHNLH